MDFIEKLDDLRGQEFASIKESGSVIGELVAAKSLNREALATESFVDFSHGKMKSFKFYEAINRFFKYMNCRD